MSSPERWRLHSLAPSYDEASLDGIRIEFSDTESSIREAVHRAVDPCYPNFSSLASNCACGESSKLLFWNELGP
jgi:hypothetical protein